MRLVFDNGAYVVYGKTGVCCVEGRKEMAFSGADKAEYYILHPHHDPTSCVYVPCDNDVLVGRMRPILTKNEIEDLLRGVQWDEVSWIDDKNERLVRYRTILSKGDRRQLICLVRCMLTERGERVTSGRKLSSADELLLKDCVRLVEEEFSVVLGIPPSQVDRYIRSIVENG